MAIRIVTRETSLDSFPRMKEKRVEMAFGDAEPFGDIAGQTLFQIAEGKHLPHQIRQTAQTSVQRRPELFPLELPDWVHPRGRT